MNLVEIINGRSVIKATKVFTLICGIAICLNAMTVSASSMLGDEQTQPKVLKFCEEKYWRDPGFIGTCVSNQIDALARLEHYLESEWKDVPEGHPVFNIFSDSMKKSVAMVDGEPWVDWLMVKYRFKHSLQDWLKAQGKVDPMLNSYL
ncbi:hypothetical protein ACPV4X_26460 [Vibrio owensii]|uniref:hypothetical protein n=1 Tax=Vibrio owensii TaxID=696485 RepID=UPI004068801E